MVINNKKVTQMATEDRCPCGLDCRERRPAIVNLVIEREICSANELRSLLKKRGFGISATRSSLRFLSERKCHLIDVLTSVDRAKILQFPKEGRMYFTKDIRKDKLRKRIRSLLTRLQREILQKLEKHHKNIYYFSLYELKKLEPYAGSSVDYAVERLSQLELVEKVKIGMHTFFVKDGDARRLRLETLEAIVDDRTEFAVVKRVHELIMNLYPLDLIDRLKGAIRPRSRDILRTTGGMTFDIFYQFTEPIGNKRFLAVDVYTRIPVTGYVVNSFLKKIEWAGTTDRTSTNYQLRDRTYGMIVYRAATRNAINLANRRGIRFIRLSDAKINYEKIQEAAMSTIDESTIS